MPARKAYKFASRARVAESRVKLQLAAAGFASPVYTFAVDVDQLDLDRYAGGEAARKIVVAGAASARTPRRSARERYADDRRAEVGRREGIQREDRAAMSFAGEIVAWQRAHGRHDLPWQGTRDPYRIWVSEIMLQQTQVATVIPYYSRFIARFPDVAALAAAHEDEVLAHWSGLGYYSRARNLHRAAQRGPRRHGGRFPRDVRGGRRAARHRPLDRRARSWCSRTARATPILDGNVKRVLARVCGIAGYPGRQGDARSAVARSGAPAAAPRRRGVHAGPDGSGRERMRAPAAEMRSLSR